MTTSFRPETLAEVARRTRSGDATFDHALREFLDTFYAAAAEHREAAIAAPPEPLDELRDAYLAAVAEHLASTYEFTVPEWSVSRGLDLERPFFAGGLESLKAQLFVESPAAFRRRLLFVGKDALSRPHAGMRA